MLIGPTERAIGNAAFLMNIVSIIMPPSDPIGVSILAKLDCVFDKLPNIDLSTCVPSNSPNYRKIHHRHFLRRLRMGFQLHRYTLLLASSQPVSTLVLPRCSSNTGKARCSSSSVGHSSSRKYLSRRLCRGGFVSRACLLVLYVLWLHAILSCLDWSVTICPWRHSQYHYGYYRLALLSSIPIPIL
jgi:hypothetical protein